MTKLGLPNTNEETEAQMSVVTGSKSVSVKNA